MDRFVKRRHGGATRNLGAARDAARGRDRLGRRAETAAPGRRRSPPIQAQSRIRDACGASGQANRRYAPLTLAALQLTISGVGVAWVPASLAESELRSGRLQDASESMPVRRIAIVATRLIGHKSPLEESIWNAFADCAES